MVLGSGLGYLGDEVEAPIAIDYKDIPHFKASTAPELQRSAAGAAELVALSAGRAAGRAVLRLPQVRDTAFQLSDSGALLVSQGGVWLWTTR